MTRRLFPLLLLACACVVEARPAPPPRVLSGPEAVAIAAQFARSRGLVIDTTYRAYLDRRARWHLDLGGAAGQDRALVTLDGFSGRVLNARLLGPRGAVAPAPAAPPPAATAGPPTGAPPEPTAPPEPPPGAPPPPPPGTPPPPPAG